MPTFFKDRVFINKYRLSQSYSPWSNTSIDVKTGSPVSADFVTTRLLLLDCGMQGEALGTSRCDGADMPMVAQPLGKLPTLAIMFIARPAKRLCGPFSAALAVRAMVVRPLAYRSSHCSMCQ
jgi:hypothetical protein